MAVIVLFAVFIGACGESPEQQLDRLGQRGASCDEMFAKRYELRLESPDDADVLNNVLIRWGCHTSSATPTVSAPSAHPPAYSVDQYRHSIAFCRTYRQDVMSQSGAASDTNAAAWYAETYRPGPARDGARIGCLDGLRGTPSKHP